jgi:hypothetical protein
MKKELKTKYFGETNGLLRFVNDNKITEIVAITTGDRLLEGYILFYWDYVEQNFKVSDR